MNRKKMKKYAALFLAGTLAATSLAACGEKEEGKAEEKNGTTLSMAWWGNQVRNERTQEVLNKYHEENPEVTIEGQFFQWADYWNKNGNVSGRRKYDRLIANGYICHYPVCRKRAAFRFDAIY